MRIIKISSTNFNQVIKEIIKVIQKEGVVISPTDTVYGLIADAFSEKAVRQVFKIKKRPLKKPIPIFVRDLKMAKNFANINKDQEKFLKKFWPGKLTAVLVAKSKKFPKEILGEDGKIGIRVPDYKLINILLKKLNIPLTGTSANISGEPSLTKINEILNQFRNQKYQPDIIIDAGNLKPSLSSTVIDLENFQILREGAISKKEIFKIFKKMAN